MTTQIKATCPDCGEVNLTPEDVQLMVCTVQTLSYYAFDCGGCVRQVRKPADDRIVTLLKSGGVRVQRWRIPAEALEEKNGPAVGYDDVLDFALAVGDTDYLADLARAARIS
jgi:hypothetical protein